METNQNKRKITNIFSGKTYGGKWWKGEVSMRYNLKKLFKILVLLAILAIGLTALFFVGKGVYWLLCVIVDFVANTWAYLCGLAIGTLLIFAFIKWRIYIPKFKKKEEDIDNTKKNGKNNWKWWLITLLLMIIAIPLFLLKNCSSSKHEPETVVVYEYSFNDVITTRAYLDGVQNEVTKECPRALVGFKFINDRPVNGVNFSGLTYEEAVKIVSQDWQPLIVDNLPSSAKLSNQQMVVVTLTAMRMGKNGFPRSTFLQKIKEGNLEEAGKWLLLQDENGNIRKTGDEPRQYFYILRLLWENEITTQELLDFPMFSYKSVDVKSMYDQNGDYIFNKDIKRKLESSRSSSFKSARQALGL